MDDPQDFDEQQMKLKVEGIIERAYEGRIAFVKAMSMPGITFSSEQRTQIDALVKAGDMEGAQSIILDKLTQAFDEMEAVFPVDVVVPETILYHQQQQRPPGVTDEEIAEVGDALARGYWPVA